MNSRSALTYRCPPVQSWNTGSEHVRMSTCVTILGRTSEWMRNTVNEWLIHPRGEPMNAIESGPWDLSMRLMFSPPDTLNVTKSLISHFRDSHCSHPHGSCKLVHRFLWRPLGERVLMNVLPVSWKLFPSRHHCLPSCNLADWWRDQNKKTPFKDCLEAILLKCVQNTEGFIGRFWSPGSHG